MSLNLNSQAEHGAAGSAASAPRSDKRRRKTQRLRRLVAEEAVALFEQKGFSATTVDEIAEAADSSTSTFFRLFADKEEVVFYDFPDWLEELKSLFAAPDREYGNAWIAIREIFIDFARRWDVDDARFGRRRAQLFHSEPALYARFLTKNVSWQDAIAQLVLTELRDEASPELLAQVVAGSAIAAFRSAWQFQLQSADRVLDACVRTAFDQLEDVGHFIRNAPAAHDRDGEPRHG